MSKSKYPRIGRVEKREKNTRATCKCGALGICKVHIQISYMRGDDEVLWACNDHKRDAAFLLTPPEEKAIEQSELKEGDKVHYQPGHYPENEWENGIVKEIPGHTADSVRVVYNCGGNWDRYREYTSALTNLRDLKRGWK